MERYAINPTRRKLHRQECRHSKAAFESSENQNLSQLLAQFGKPLQCCKVCLKDDETAQELVKQHNDQFGWHPKKNY
ncbi:MAG: hypothetical protein KHX28_07980 [Oscillospiraceae bacterium]|nr:hypothetical protein [Oscillospiraceae bacterium]